jgi:hypothetical protein
MRIITALQVKLTEGEQGRMYEKATDSLKAYLKTLQARGHFLFPRYLKNQDRI